MKTGVTKRQYLNVAPTNKLGSVLANYDSPGKWQSTIITGDVSESEDYAVARLVWHVVMWIVTIVLVGCYGGGIFADGGPLAPDDAVNGTVSNSSYTLEPSGATKTIGLFSLLSLIAGFFFMIPMAAVYDYEEFQKKGWPNVVLQLFTNFAFVAQLHVLAHAGANPENEFFNQSVVTCVFTGYLVVLLYCISASLDFLMLPRGFIPTLAFSFQLVNCIVIRADEGGAPVGGYSDEQKMVAIFLVVLNASAIAVMVMFRNLTRSDDEDAGLRNWPILRSVVLTLFRAAALSIYEWSFTNSADRGVVLLRDERLHAVPDHGRRVQPVERVGGRHQRQDGQIVV